MAYANTHTRARKGNYGIKCSIDWKMFRVSEWEIETRWWRKMWVKFRSFSAVRDCDTTCDILIVTQLIAILFAVSCFILQLILYHHYNLIIIILLKTIAIPSMQNGFVWRRWLWRWFICACDLFFRWDIFFLHLYYCSIIFFSTCLENHLIMLTII